MVLSRGISGEKVTKLLHYCRAVHRKGQNFHWNIRNFCTVCCKSMIKFIIINVTNIKKPYIFLKHVFMFIRESEVNFQWTHLFYDMYFVRGIFMDTHDDMPPKYADLIQYFTIIYKCNDILSVKIAEAILIKNDKPIINT